MRPSGDKSGVLEVGGQVQHIILQTLQWSTMSPPPGGSNCLAYPELERRAKDNMAQGEQVTVSTSFLTLAKKWEQ